MTRPLTLYLGWGNPRRAYTLRDHNIVILLDGTQSRVLQGELGREALTSFSNLAMHLTGVRRSPTVETWIRSLALPDDPDDLGIYDALFDEFWGKAP